MNEMNQTWFLGLDSRKCIADYTFVRLSAVVFVRLRSVSGHAGAPFRPGAKIYRLYSDIRSVSCVCLGQLLMSGFRLWDVRPHLIDKSSQLSPTGDLVHSFHVQHLFHLIKDGRRSTS